MTSAELANQYGFVPIELIPKQVPIVDGLLRNPNLHRYGDPKKESLKLAGDLILDIQQNKVPNGSVYVIPVEIPTFQTFDDLVSSLPPDHGLTRAQLRELAQAAKSDSSQNNLINLVSYFRGKFLDFRLQEGLTSTAVVEPHVGVYASLTSMTFLLNFSPADYLSIISDLPQELGLGYSKEKYLLIGGNRLNLFEKQ